MVELPKLEVKTIAEIIGELEAQKFFPSNKHKLASLNRYISEPSFKVWAGFLADKIEKRIRENTVRNGVAPENEFLKEVLVELRTVGMG